MVEPIRLFFQKIHDQLKAIDPQLSVIEPSSKITSDQSTGQSVRLFSAALPSQDQASAATKDTKDTEASSAWQTINLDI